MGDWDRATRFVAVWGNQPGMREALQQVLDETREATIRECVYSAESRLSGLHAADPIAFALRAVVRDLLALLTPPSAPAEPKCKVCGEGADYAGHYRMEISTPYHAFEPEEPGHG